MTAIAELEPYTGGHADEYRPRIVMAPADAKALDDQLRASMTAVLRKDVDYGVIPGMGDKPTLLKPGAEKLLQWFGFGFVNERDETERDGNGNRIGVIYRCTVTKGLPGGHEVTVATCEGYAGYDEDRFYVSAEQAWAKEQANADRYKRQPRKWKAVEYRAPWNTVIKMAQKRALVGAAIDATAAGGLFTQDLEDMPRPDDGDTGTAPQQPAGDSWDDATPARPPNGHQDDQPRWIDQALVRAAGWKTEAAGQELWLEASAAVLDGRCTPGEATRVKNTINGRLADRRKAAATRILKPLAEDDPWRETILELASGSDDDARSRLAEVQQLVSAGTLDDDRGKLLGRAIVAVRPKAALAGETDG